MLTKKLYLLISFLALFLVACSNTASDEAKNDEANKEITNEEKKSNEEHTDHWTYEGETGLEHWGDINPEFATCTNGKEQSPINIDTSQVLEDENIADWAIQYGPTNLSLTNNGHAIQANPLTMDNSLVIDDKEYNLSQLHFHSPSEHQFNGQSFDMEVHFVNKDANEELVVLALMIKEGASNTHLAKAWDVLPTEHSTEDVKLTEPVDLMNLLPEEKDSFQYNGSLTTPPCAENVKWIVLQEPIEMSKEQIDQFREIYHNNHRPVQPLNERKVIKDD